MLARFRTAYAGWDPWSLTVSVFREMLAQAGPARDWLEGDGASEMEGREARQQNDRRTALMKLLPEIFAAEPANG